MNQRLLTGIALLCTTAMLSGCFSDRAAAPVETPTPIPTTPGAPDPAPDPIVTRSVGGTVTGLGGGGLQLTGSGTTITVNANGAFTLLTGVAAGTAYSVSVAAQPTSPHQVCTVANGAGTVGSADVVDIAVSCVDAVRMTAQVTDAPIAHASVTVKVGDRFYTTTADATGTFSISIPILSGTGAEMVTAEAQGVDGQTHVTFANILGTLDAVVASADADGSVSSATSSNVNITNVSTAKYVLVLQANDGELPATGDALQTAERSVNATAVMNLAAAIKLIVDSPDTFTLPVGKTSIMEFASDPVAVQAFVDAAPVEAMEQALTEILADTSLVPGYRADEVPGVYFIIPAAQPGFLSPAGSGLVLDEDGTGTFLTSSAGGSPVTATLEWAVVDGIVKVSYDHPVSTTSSPGITEENATAEQLATLQCAGIFQATRTDTVTERDYILVSSGTLVDQVRVTTFAEQTYDPIAVPAVCDPSESVQLAPSIATTAGTVEVWKEAELPPMPFTADELVGKQWGIYLLLPVGPFFGDAFPVDQFTNELIEFHADGTATVEGREDLVVTWEFNAFNDLHLFYGDWQQEVAKLQVSGDAVKAVMHFQSVSDETVQFAYFNLAVRKDPALLADGAAALWVNDEGMYWNTYTNGWSPAAWDNGEPVFSFGAQTFGWSFNAGGQAFNHQFFFETMNYDTWVNGDVELRSAWHREMAWEIDEASETDGWIGFSGPMVNGCYDAVPQVTCYRRDWLPLGRNEDGLLFVIEQVWRSGDDGATWGLWIAPRITPVRQAAFPAVDQEGTSLISP